MKSLFTKETRKTIRELMRSGVHAYSIPWNTDLYIDEVMYDEYNDLPPAAKVELCRMEAAVYLESFPDATKEERRRVREYARLGYSVYDYAPELYHESDLLSATRLWEELRMSASNNPVPVPDDAYDDLPF